MTPVPARRGRLGGRHRGNRRIATPVSKYDFFAIQSTLRVALRLRCAQQTMPVICAGSIVSAIHW